MTTPTTDPTSVAALLDALTDALAGPVAAPGRRDEYAMRIYASQARHCLPAVAAWLRANADLDHAESLIHDDPDDAAMWRWGATALRERADAIEAEVSRG